MIFFVRDLYTLSIVTIFIKAEISIIKKIDFTKWTWYSLCNISQNCSANAIAIGSQQHSIFLFESCFGKPDFIILQKMFIFTPNVSIIVVFFFCCQFLLSHCRFRMSENVKRRQTDLRYRKFLIFKEYTEHVFVVVVVLIFLVLINEEAQFDVIRQWLKLNWRKIFQDSNPKGKNRNKSTYWWITI